MIRMMVCMLGICLMLNSCYHRHNSHQQHAAMLEYSDRQLDSISFSTTTITPTNITLWCLRILSI